MCQQSSNILTPAQVRKFAQHFIFWRRAIAIPPLHARDMYIVSPNCDLRKLPQATAQWARQFPLSPALPNFLAELSVAPRPYKMHCPSKAHRPVYMAMLAWLMRGGWVTQLCTFAYVVVWPEIIYEVEHALEAEEIAREKRAQSMGHEPGSLESDDAAAAAPDAQAAVAALGDPAVAGFASGFLPLLPDTSDPNAAAFRDLPLPHSRPMTAVRPSRSQSQASVLPLQTNPASPATSSSPARTTTPQPQHAQQQQQPNNGPTPTEQAAEQARLERIADKAARELAERATAHARKTPPRATPHPSVNDAPHLEGISPHIILDANKATGKESLYLSAIGRRFRERAERAAAARREDGAAAGAAGGSASGSGTGGGAAGGRAGPRGIGGVSHGGGGVRDGGALWEERVADAWPVFCKYFNGRCALERIALQEDMKRKDVWNLLTAMSEYLLCVRHW